jgi:DNA polymerase III subunit beta
MNFTISKSVLYDALQKVVGVVPQKTTISILTCILLELEENKLSLTGTDLEISVTLSLDVDSSGNGAVAIPAKLFLEIVRELPEVPLNITTEDGDKVIIKTEKGEYKIAAQPKEDFPKISVEESELAFELSGELLARMTSKTIFAVSADELRPALTGILVEMMPEEIRFVGTDGHRLARISSSKFTVPDETRHNLIVPTKALNMLLKNYGSEESVSIKIGEDHIVFTLNSSVIYSKLINGTYPSYERVIPADNDKKLQVNRELLISTLRRVSIFSSSLTHQVRLILSPAEMTIHSEDIEFGAEAKETIPASFNGDFLQIGYNSNYLIDVLRHVDSDDVIFELKDSTSAAIIYPPTQEDDEFLTMLLMPIRISEEEPAEETAQEEEMLDDAGSDQSE